ncbi:MAG: protease complex subunit PrcB family protein [Bryobacteraceae bacterium]
MRGMLALLAGLCWTVLSVEDVPFEVLKQRPRRQSVQAQYEVERRSEGVIVTIHAGRKPTGGYAVKILRVSRDGARCTVHYAVIPPPEDAMVPQVLTYPSVSVKIPAACADVTVQPPLPRATPGAAGALEQKE